MVRVFEATIVGGKVGKVSDRWMWCPGIRVLVSNLLLLYYREGISATLDSTELLDVQLHTRLDSDVLARGLSLVAGLEPESNKQSIIEDSIVQSLVHRPDGQVPLVLFSRVQVNVVRTFVR